MSKATKQRKCSRRGRPEGAANHEAAAVDKPLARCPKCGGTDLRVLRRIGEQKICGTLPDGSRFTCVVRRRARCQACGQHTILVSRPFDPTAWPSVRTSSRSASVSSSA